MYNLESLKLIIFDFDGVIADTFSWYYELNRKAMAHVGMNLSVQDYRCLFNTNIHAGFAQYIGDKGKLEQFINYKKCIKDTMHEAQLFPGIFEVVDVLSHRFHLAIASATTNDSIKSFLVRHNMLDYFDPIIGGGAKTKKIAYQDILVHCGVKASESLMISDTVGDLHEARELDLLTCAVDWGFQVGSDLRLIKPDLYCTSPSEILTQVLDKS